MKHIFYLVGTFILLQETSVQTVKGKINIITMNEQVTLWLQTFEWSDTYN